MYCTFVGDKINTAFVGVQHRALNIQYMYVQYSRSSQFLINHICFRLYGISYRIMQHIYYTLLPENISEDRVTLL
jgi:hypothetical protein